MYSETWYMPVCEDMAWNGSEYRTYDEAVRAMERMKAAYPNVPYRFKVETVTKFVVTCGGS